MTLQLSPQFPLPNVEVTVTSTLNSTGAIANGIVLEVTSVPPKSKVPLGLIHAAVGSDPQSPVEVLETELDVRTRQPDLEQTTFRPDTPGEYGLTLHHWYVWPPMVCILGSDVGASPEDYKSQLRFKDKDSGTVHVGANLDLPIVIERGHGATLRVQINNEYIRGASVVEPTTELARVAALQPSVTAALAALVGTTVGDAIGDLQERVEDLRVQYRDHILGATWHLVADNLNVVTRFEPTSQDSAIAVLNELRQRLVAHLDQRTTGLRVHTNDDQRHLPLVAPARTLAEATVLAADLRERVFERHRVADSGSTPEVHTIAGGDTVNALSAPTALDDVIVSFVDAMVEADPAVVAGESEGAFDAAHAAGFAPV